MTETNTIKVNAVAEIEQEEFVELMSNKTRVQCDYENYEHDWQVVHQMDKKEMLEFEDWIWRNRNKLCKEYAEVFNDIFSESLC